MLLEQRWVKSAKQAFAVQGEHRRPAQRSNRPHAQAVVVQRSAPALRSHEHDGASHGDLTMRSHQRQLHTATAKQIAQHVKAHVGISDQHPSLTSADSVTQSSGPLLHHV